MQCNLVNLGNGHDDADSKYNLRSPYVATLTQYALAAPGGSQPDLHHALRHSNRLRRQATIPPLFAPQDYPEIRLLSERPDDIHDARQLFSAGQKAGLVVPIGHAGDRYQLANHEPRLECLFADAKLAAESRPAAFFQKLLHDSIFVNLVASLFPALRDWRKTDASARDAALSLPDASDVDKTSFCISNRPAHVWCQPPMAKMGLAWRRPHTWA